MNECLGKSFGAKDLRDCLLNYLKPLNDEPLSFIQMNEELYLKVIRQFLKDNTKKIVEITGAVKSGDVKLYSERELTGYFTKAGFHTTGIKSEGKCVVYSFRKPV
jgi:hypothetical protein